MVLFQSFTLGTLCLLVYELLIKSSCILILPIGHGVRPILRRYGRVTGLTIEAPTIITSISNIIRRSGPIQRPIKRLSIRPIHGPQKNLPQIGTPPLTREKPRQKRLRRTFINLIRDLFLC